MMKKKKDGLFYVLKKKTTTTSMMIDVDGRTMPYPSQRELLGQLQEASQWDCWMSSTSIKQMMMAWW